MRPTVGISLLALLTLGAALPAAAQHRGGGGMRSGGFARGGHNFSHNAGRGRVLLPYGFGYGDLGYDSGPAYSYDTQPAVFIEPPAPPAYEPPAPRVFNSPGHAVITEYKWPAAAPAAPAAFDSQPQTFSIVLKDGSTLSAVMIFASDDGLHYVDSDENHLRLSMSQVDRAATLKLNRARNLNLYLPAAQ